MLNEKAAVSGIILAGGKSARMGTDKALLKVGPCCIIERIASVFRPVVDEILVVTDRPDKFAEYGDKTIGDIMPGHGPLGGLHAGLVRASHARVLVAACDLPFISAPLACLLIQCAADYDAVVPRYRGYPEPLCALYSKNCIKIIEQRLTRNQNKITGLYDQVRVRYIEETEMLPVEPHPERVLFNLNTPGDLKKARSWIAGC